MILVFAAIVGVVFAVIGIRKGFFPMWLVLFNILVSIYLGVMLSPTVAAIWPDMEQNRYYMAAFTAGTSFVLFVVLQNIVKALFGNLAENCCPKFFDIAGAGALGFLAGFLVFSFIYFVVCMMPFSKKPFMQGLCGDGASTPDGVRPVVKACVFVSGISLQPYCGFRSPECNVVDCLVRTDRPFEFDLGSSDKDTEPPDSVDPVY
jgi:uncharacterized membrane protein required for colicin V production